MVLAGVREPEFGSSECRRYLCDPNATALKNEITHRYAHPENQGHPEACAWESGLEENLLKLIFEEGRRGSRSSVWPAVSTARRNKNLVQLTLEVIAAKINPDPADVGYKHARLVENVSFDFP